MGFASLVYLDGLYMGSQADALHPYTTIFNGRLSSEDKECHSVTENDQA